MFYFKSLNAVEVTEFPAQSEESPTRLDFLSITPLLPSHRLECCDRIDSEDFDKSSHDSRVQTTNRKSSYLPPPKKKPNRKWKRKHKKTKKNKKNLFPLSEVRLKETG